jgi:hypothetical protein
MKGEERQHLTPGQITVLRELVVSLQSRPAFPLDPDTLRTMDQVNALKTALTLLGCESHPDLETVRPADRSGSDGRRSRTSV